MLRPGGILKKILIGVGIVIGIVVLIFAILLIIGLSLSRAPEPIIKSVTFPSKIPLDEKVEGKLEFEDGQGDIVEMHMDDIDGAQDRSVLDLRPFDMSGAYVGTLTFLQLVEKKSPQVIQNRITLVDNAGHRSKPYLLEYAGGDTEEIYGKYDAQQANSEPVTRHITLHIFVINDTATELAEGAVFPSTDVAEGEVSAPVRRALERAVIRNLNGIWDQCGLAFDLGATKVLRAQRVYGSGKRTLASLFGTHNGKQSFNLRSSVRLTELDDMLPGLGVKAGERALFLIGNPLWNLEEGKESAGSSGKRSVLVQWRNIHFLNEESGDITVPKRMMSTIAHELGHSFDLKHPDDEPRIPQTKFAAWNLMVRQNLGSELIPEQCNLIQPYLSR